MRIPWLYIGFCLGVLSQHDGMAALAYDLGVWTRCAVVECPE